MWAVNAKYARQSFACVSAILLRFGRQRLSTSPAYNIVMYIVLIAWLYVTTLMALTEGSIVAGILTLLFYGVLPAALFTWLFAGRWRRRTGQQSSAVTSPGKKSTAADDPEH